jgi:hypothetical protein
MPLSDRPTDFSFQPCTSARNLRNASHLGTEPGHFAAHAGLDGTPGFVLVIKSRLLRIYVTGGIVQAPVAYVVDVGCHTADDRLGTEEFLALGHLIPNEEARAWAGSKL